MFLYIILDWSTDIIFWLIKNLGKGGYYTICYLFGKTYDNPEKKTQLKELIEQKKDIEEIKKLLEELKKNN
tara:strand:- start:1146 stop:1358 length:213 start_codon:yes stop_codon:yes gene_type:complete